MSHHPPGNKTGRGSIIMARPCRSHVELVRSVLSDLSSQEFESKAWLNWVKREAPKKFRSNKSTKNWTIHKSRSMYLYDELRRDVASLDPDPGEHSNFANRHIISNYFLYYFTQIVLNRRYIFKTTFQLHSGIPSLKIRGSAASTQKSMLKLLSSDDHWFYFIEWMRK